MAVRTLKIPFRDRLGIEVLSAENGHSHLVLPFCEDLTNGAGVVHGGALATLLDIAMAYAAASLIPDVHLAVTADMQIQYLRPGRGDLHGWGEVSRSGSHFSFAEARILDGTQEVVAKGQGTFVIRTRPDE